MVESKSNCMFCGKPLKGRADKKFCGSDCRTAYHNEAATQDGAEVRRITNILRNNRKILKALLGNAKGKKAKKDIMMRKGFSFDYITQVSGSYRFCFEYGYCNSKNDQYFIVKGFDEIVNKE